MNTLHARHAAADACTSRCGRGRSRAAPARRRRARRACSRPAARADQRRRSEFQAVITRTYLMPSAGSTGWRTSPASARRSRSRGSGAACAARLAGAATAIASSTPSSSARSISPPQDGVLVRVGGAQQHRSTSGSGPVLTSLWRDPGGITTVSPARTGPSWSPSRMRPMPLVNRVDLLRGAVEVLDRGAAGRHGRLGERLVRGVAGRDPRQLADRGSVGGDERCAVFQAGRFEHDWPG